MKNSLQNLQTTANMTGEIEARVEVKAETETQEVVNKVHFPHMRWKTIKNGLQMMNKRSSQNILLREDKDFPSLTKIPKRKCDKISSW